MAEAFPSAILDSVLKQLESPFFQRNKKLNYGLGNQLRDLGSRLKLIKPVIYEAELMGILFPNLVRKWVCKLQCILHELDDLMDEARTRSMADSGMIEKARLHLHNLPFDLTLARKMKDINQRIEGIVKKCYECNLLIERGGEPIARKGILRYVPDHYAAYDEPEMIGRDDDKKTIIKMLFDQDLNKAVVQITGAVGVGKTTLCRAVYHDEEVGKHFEVRVWFGLEDVKEFHAIDLWNKIVTTLPEARSHNPDTLNEDQLIKEIIGLIWRRKILLVLDGFPPYSDTYPSPVGNLFWSNLKDWKAEKAAEYGGTKILVPSKEKGNLVGDCPNHELKGDLSEEHCWHIFKNTSLVPGHYREEWRVDMRKEIVRRCERNPALLKGLGTLFHGEVSEATWKHVVDEFHCEVQYDYYSTVSSVHYLFQTFRQSCAYLSLFTNDEFKYEVLKNQIEANEFPKFTDKMRLKFQNILLEQTKETLDWDDSIKYKIQACTDELTHLAGANSTILGWRETGLPEAAQHVSIARPSSSTELTEQQQQEKIIRLPESLIDDVIHRRSLLFFGKLNPIRMSVQTLDKLASNLLYLRVLVLQDMALKELPSSIGKLIHLRYLDVSLNDFKELPRSIFRLKNLRTLRLFYCDKLIRLPRCIRSLRSLEHLVIGMCLELTHMPSKIADLTHLQTLDQFIVGPRKGGLRYLENLDRLNGHLTIVLPRQWQKSVEDAAKANLMRKKGLTVLKFKWQGMCDDDKDQDNYDVLEKLEPWHGIEKLSIENFAGKEFPSWIQWRICLTQITISHGKGYKILPPFHGFPKLKFLTLESLMDMEYMQGDNGGDASSAIFPSLIELKIGNMPKLKGWSRDNGRSSRFSKVIDVIEIWDCPRLTTMIPFCGRKQVILQGDSERILSSIDCGKLQKLNIISIKKMVSLPHNIITNSPNILAIENCNELEEFWTNEDDRTQTQISAADVFERPLILSVKDCSKMGQLSSVLKHLTGLRSLEISACSEQLDCLHGQGEDGMPWKALQNLTKLKIEGFKTLEAIPKGFRHLPSLEKLIIVDCESLKLGADRLPEVKQQLHIKSCPRFIEELKREHPDVTMNGKEVVTKWPLCASTSRKTGAP